VPEAANPIPGGGDLYLPVWCAVSRVIWIWTLPPLFVDCHCVTIITETWPNDNIPDAAIELAGCSIYRADCAKDSGKRRGGGLCEYVNNSWCIATDIVVNIVAQKYKTQLILVIKTVQ